MRSEEWESVEAAAMNWGKPCEAVRAVRLSCFFSFRRRRQRASRRNGRRTNDLARGFLVRYLEPLHVEQLDVELDELLQRRPTLLVPHLLRQLALRHLIDEPLQLLLGILDAPFPSILLPLTLENLRLDPEGEDLAPDVEVGFRAGGGGDVRDLACEKVDGRGELVLLRGLERGEGGESLGEEREEFGVGVERDEDFLARAVGSVAASARRAR